MGKLKLKRFAYTDGPTGRRWLPVQDGTGLGAHLLLCHLVWAGDRTGETYLALACAKGALPPDSLTESRARLILRMLGVVDGVVCGDLQEWEKAFAAALVLLPLNRRALLYYECCDRLGFDPAEESWRD